MFKYRIIHITIVLFLCEITFGQESDTEFGYNDTLGENFIISIMNRVNDFRFNISKSKPGRDWKQATYYAGVMAFFRATQNRQLLEQAIEWSSKNRWEAGNELMFPANRFTCVQTYLEIFFQTRDTSQIVRSKVYMDSRLKETEPAYLRGWYYIDALFVGPPAFFMMSKATGKNKYANYINPVFWEVADQLYDEKSGLFFRDSEARFNEKSKNGKKVLWSRGNGWVIASLPRILSNLPEDDPYYENYRELLISMSEALKDVQGDDGMWRPNLDDPIEYPMPESSGTAFFTYAIAWGINNDMLDRDEYLPVVSKSWKALCSVVDKNGKVCWGQSVARGPGKVDKEDSDDYVSGAFLLAGSEILKFVRNQD